MHRGTGLCTEAHSRDRSAGQHAVANAAPAGSYCPTDGFSPNPKAKRKVKMDREGMGRVELMVRRGTELCTEAQGCAQRHRVAKVVHRGTGLCTEAHRQDRSAGQHAVANAAPAGSYCPADGFSPNPKAKRKVKVDREGRGRVECWPVTAGR